MKDRNMEGEPKLNQQEIIGEEIINPPQDWYFIHGVKDWSSKDRIRVLSPEISGSLQKDGYTKPLRPYGYILKVDKGGISRAFSRDVTSEYGENYKKQLSKQGKARKRKQYNENDLQALVDDTREGTHNELWFTGDKVEIVGSYITERGRQDPGAKAFLKECRKQNLQVRFVKEQDGGSR